MPIVAAVLLLAILFYSGGYVKQSIDTQNLDNINAADFGAWFPLMSDQLLSALDEFFYEVERVGGIAYVSPASGSLGRYLGDDKHSQHNIDFHGEIRAADIMIEGITLDDAYSIARQLRLFSGIGVYPQWTPAPGLHLDVRETRSPESPALWARIDGQYVSISQAVIV